MSDINMCYKETKAEIDTDMNETKCRFAALNNLDPNRR